jgi:uncharacterized protein
MIQNTSAAEISPIAGRSRIQSIDVLRGFALLGILLMNIIAFAFPFAIVHLGDYIYEGT